MTVDIRPAIPAIAPPHEVVRVKSFYHAGARGLWGSRRPPTANVLAMPSPRLVALLLLAMLAVAGCGREIHTDDTQQSPALLGASEQSRANLGFPEFATKNTTRLPGADPVQLAAAVVRGVYPDPARKPKAITLVDSGDWRVAIAATALMAAPFNPPMLFPNGTKPPHATPDTLRAPAPHGSAAARHAPGIPAGHGAAPAGAK